MRVSARCATASICSKAIARTWYHRQNSRVRDARAFGHRRELGPDHVGIDRGLADPGAIAAVAAGDTFSRPTSLA